MNPNIRAMAFAGQTDVKNMTNANAHSCVLPKKAKATDKIPMPFAIFCHVELTRVRVMSGHFQGFLFYQACRQFTLN